MTMPLKSFLLATTHSYWHCPQLCSNTPSSLFWNLTVFTAFIKSKLSNNPLTVLYSSLLLVLCMDKIVATIIYYGNSFTMQTRSDFA